jgi:hypothetical protein
LEYALVIVALLALVRWGERLVPREIARGTWVLAGVALVLRMFFVTPAFVHDAFHGPLILNGVLDFPWRPGPGTYGSGYGPGSFTILGLLSLALGRSAEGVMRANVVVSALATIPLAGAAAHLGKRPRAGLYAAALWAGSPLVARLAHSEDPHIVGIAFALAGIAWAESAAWPAAIATGIAVFTRQSFIPFALLGAGMLIERKRRGESVARIGWLCGALIAIVILRIIATAQSSDGTELIVGLSLVPRHPRWLLGFLASHPLFSTPRLSPIVLVLFIAGAIEIARHGRVRISLGLTWLMLFALSLASSFPAVGVRWSFRLPVYTLSMLLAGVGAAWLEWRLQPRGRSWLVVAALSASLAATATLENLRPNAEFVEYCYLRDTLKRVRRPLVANPEAGPGWRLPRALAERMRLPIVSAPAPGAIFFDGLGCHAWDMLELARAEKASPHQLPARPELERVLSLTLDPERRYGLDTVPHPEGTRPDCARLLEEAAPLDVGPTVTLDDNPPMGIFGQRELTLRFVEWRQ